MYFDIGMPLTLFAITLLSLFLNQKTESRLKMTFEERQFATRDVVLLVVFMAIMVSSIALSIQYSFINPIMILFLFSYSALLFVFTYIFSNKRWYLAILPSVIFILLYLFLKDTVLWSYYLVNIYAAIFAVLVVLYMGTLFTWKTTWIFTILIVTADIILVFVTKSMVEYAEVGIGLRLPVVIALPIIPLIVTEQGTLWTILGLGDFFFAGLLSIQIFKRNGKKTAILSAMAIAVAFFIYEIYSLNYQPQPFPATLIIILGWLPIALWKNRHDIRRIHIGKNEVESRSLTEQGA
jgi:hypothetical protein